MALHFLYFSSLLALAATFGNLLFGGASADQFVKHCQPFFGTQDTAQTLDIFALCTVATDDDRDPAIGHVYAFVKHTPCDQLGIFTAAKTFKDCAPFLCWCFIGDTGNAEASANLIDDV